MRWMRGFDLALDAINAVGGVKGRPLRYLERDTGSDPRQATAAAQALADDLRIIIEIGDSSSISLGAASVCARAGLVQLGFVDTDPNFTGASDHAWSMAPNPAHEPATAYGLAYSLGARRLAVLGPDSAAGLARRDRFMAAVDDAVAAVVQHGLYRSAPEDVRQILAAVRSVSPDALVLLSNDVEAALICREARSVGIMLPVVVVGLGYSPRFVEMAGPGAERVFTGSHFFPDDPLPRVRAFTDAFVARYGSKPDLIDACAYDAMVLWERLVDGWGPTRDGMQRGLSLVRTPSVVSGGTYFYPPTRRLAAEGS